MSKKWYEKNVYRLPSSFIFFKYLLDFKKEEVIHVVVGEGWESLKEEQRKLPKLILNFFKTVEILYFIFCNMFKYIVGTVHLL